MVKKGAVKGQVVSDKMDKTVVVAVDTVSRHPLYKKSMRRVRKYMAHDESNSCHVGDIVEIIETRPLSHRKRWCVVNRLESTRSEVAPVVPAEGGEQ